MAAALGASTLRGLLVYPTIILAIGPHNPFCKISKLEQMIRRMNLPGRAFFAPRIKETQIRLIESPVAWQTTTPLKSNYLNRSSRDGQAGLICRPQKGTVGLTTK